MSDVTNGVNDETAPGTDTFYRVLANPRRRNVIDLLENESTISLDDLVTALATQEGENVERREVEISLHHHHLPLLADAGLIEYDNNRQRIATRGGFDEMFSRVHAPVY